MVLNQDFKEFIESLNDNNVRYLIIGGYAVAFHGYPRYTKDLDVWIQLDRENAANVVKALDQFGFSSLGLGVGDFLEPDTIIQLGYPPSRINLVIGIKDMDFDRCYATKISVEIEGVTMHYIDLENLRKNKRSAGRLQDLADLENLE